MHATLQIIKKEERGKQSRLMNGMTSSSIFLNGPWPDVGRVGMVVQFTTFGDVQI